MNRKIKVVRSNEVDASAKKHALDIGDVAPVVLENFETLTDPPFKPRLELIEGDPHDPPTMNTNTDQNIKTDGEDQNRPSTEEIASGGSDYENAEAPEAEDIPHEHEHVKQGAKTADSDEDDKPDFLKQDEGDESEEEEADTSVTAMQKLQAEYAERYSLASQLFDIRKSAGIEEEINRYNFVQTKAGSTEITDLQSQIDDGKAYLGQMTTTAQQVQPKVANVTLPSGYTGGVPRNESPFDDDLEAVVMGGM